MSIHLRCKCEKPRLVFKKFTFTNRRIAYKGTCTSCGLVRCWQEGKNFRLVQGNSPKGGDKLSST